MVDWLAGKRVRGTSSERTTLQNSILGGTGIGGWVEVGRANASGDTITISNLADKRYYMFLMRTYPTGGNTDDIKLSFNGDTATNYSYRRSANATTADDVFASTNNFRIDAANGAYDRCNVGYVANKSGKQKLVISHNVMGSGAGVTNIPQRIETAGKWTGTSAISSFTFTNQGTGDFTSDSEVVILGYDPADTHTTNFWEELYSDTATSDNYDFDTGVNSNLSKKYLWIQVYVNDHTSTGNDVWLGLNGNVGGSNVYADRKNVNNASTDSTQASLNIGNRISSFGNNKIFYNMFIFNASGKEKLVINHAVSQSTSTAGYAPDSYESVHKCTDTNIIDRIQIYSTNGSGVKGSYLKTGSTIRIWGAD